jgi:hypothetical protein
LPNTLTPEKLTTIASDSFIEELHALSNKLGTASRKNELLFSLMESKLNSSATIRKYHDTLLFLLAYPEDEMTFLLTKIALEKLCFDLEEKEKSETGIIHSTLISSPSFDLLKRLNELFPRQIQIDSSSASKETANNVFKILLSVAEHETIDKKELSFEQRIRQLRKARPDEIFGRGKASREISWLIDLFSNRFGKEENLIDHFFNSLEIYVSFPLSEFTFSRTTLRSLAYPTYFHKTELQKRVDAKKIIEEKIKKPIQLKREEKIYLADTSRLALLMLQRETDPSTYANESEIEWHDMGNGFRIALFGMIPSRRLPFDSYIGYMAFKNGIPAAYGGAWMMGDGAKVGVNIFETLRGGESAWMFCQILRVYRQRYDVKKFVVEPYQYGKNNPEGINSGAFWFYYRLGFRPVDNELGLLAEKEAKIISEKKGYRTSKETLKKFTHSNIELNLSEKEIFFPDTESLSVAITNHIATKFSGDRKKAEETIQKYLVKALELKFSNWNSNEKEGFRKLSLLFLLVPEIDKWNKKEKKQLAELLKARGGETEFNYIKLLRQNRKPLKILSHSSIRNS